MLPVKSIFSKVVLSYQPVYHHFRKWCKDGRWNHCRVSLLNDRKSSLDLSGGDIDGSHTAVLRGGEQAAYQGRKKRKTCNSLYFTGRQGIPLAMSSTKAGNHHGLHEIEEALGGIFRTVEKAAISLDGLFINADSGFDPNVFREVCSKKGMIANVRFNYRNGDIESKDDIYFDDALYEERYSIERTNAWLDTFRSLLNRFDTTTSSWKGFNHIAFIVILLRKTGKEKSLNDFKY